MQSNGLYIRVIDERLFKTTKEVTALTRDIDYIVDKFSDDIYRAALAVTGSVHEAEDIVSEVIIKYFIRWCRVVDFTGLPVYWFTGFINLSVLLC